MDSVHPDQNQRPWRHSLVTEAWQWVRPEVFGSPLFQAGGGNNLERESPKPGRQQRVHRVNNALLDIRGEPRGQAVVIHRVFRLIAAFCEHPR